MPEPIYSIYRIRCKVNGKIYVGCTSNPMGRRISHFQRYHPNSSSSLYPDIKTYGRDMFEFDVLEEVSGKELAFTREKYWIEELNTQFPAGYNLTAGGLGFTGNHSEETKSLLSSLATEQFATPQGRKKVSDGRKGKAMGNQNAAGGPGANPTAIRDMESGVAYPSFAEAERILHKSRVNMMISCKLNRKVGHTWFEYAESKDG